MDQSTYEYIPGMLYISCKAWTRPNDGMHTHWWEILSTSGSLWCLRSHSCLHCLPTEPCDRVSVSTHLEGLNAKCKRKGEETPQQINGKQLRKPLWRTAHTLWENFGWMGRWAYTQETKMWPAVSGGFGPYDRYTTQPSLICTRPTGM